MDDREITLRVRALTKAMQNDATAEALRILGGFMKGAAPTESQLRVSFPTSSCTQEKADTTSHAGPDLC
jgi:hypothetical protein